MNAKERAIIKRLATELEEVSSRFHASITDGSEADAEAGSWVSLYRKRFARWDRTIAAARKLLEGVR